ncbi:hypothetical protein MSPP1_001435 [Malassezia sp. CBS 17886]|nr:hypothetical protein MSPP1_001435 [Malassezia sp. CBS 17886]
MQRTFGGRKIKPDGAGLVAYSDGEESDRADGETSGCDGPSEGCSGLRIHGVAKTAKDAVDKPQGDNGADVPAPGTPGVFHDASHGANKPPRPVADAPDCASSPVAPFLLPPPGNDGDTEWGLGTEVDNGVDDAVAQKVAHFYDLKTKGTHFNASLAKSRSFHNPHIYEKLIQWAGLAETGSNYGIAAQAAGRTPTFNPNDAMMLRDGQADRLAAEQKRYAEKRESAKAAGSRSSISFTKRGAAGPDACERTRTHPDMRRRQ